MFTLAGLRDDKVFWGILSTGVINLIATLIALKLIELLGRRPLIIWPLVAISLVMVTLTILIVINVRYNDTTLSVSTEQVIELFLGKKRGR